MILIVGACVVGAGTLASMFAGPQHQTRVLSHAPQVQVSRLGDGVNLTRHLHVSRSHDHRGSVTRIGPGSSKFITVGGN
ncbi:MAG: hypothetical protein AAGF60_12745 [Pseudomonadota bacterium]